MDKRNVIFIKNHWFFKIRYIIVLSFLLFSVLVSTIYYTFSKDTSSEQVNIDNIYNTWKVLKYYENGKLIVNKDRFENLRLRINRDGTADWIKDGYESNIEFSISLMEDRIFANKNSLEGREIIYELDTTRLRFGKRDQMAHYEYVMVPWDYKK